MAVVVTGAVQQPRETMPAPASLQSLNCRRIRVDSVGLIPWKAPSLTPDEPDKNYFLAPQVNLGNLAEAVLATAMKQAPHSVPGRLTSWTDRAKIRKRRTLLGIVLGGSRERGKVDLAALREYCGRLKSLPPDPTLSPSSAVGRLQILSSNTTTNSADERVIRVQCRFEIGEDDRITSSQVTTDLPFEAFGEFILDLGGMAVVEFKLQRPHDYFAFIDEIVRAIGEGGLAREEAALSEVVSIGDLPLRWGITLPDMPWEREPTGYDLLGHPIYQ